MRITQTYESAIIDTASGMSAHLVVLPARSVPSQFPADEKALFNSLGLRLIARLRPAGLSMYVLSILSSDSLHWPEDSKRPPVVKVPDKVTSEQLEFAEYLTCARVIPFEESPLSAESIGNIVTKASGAGIGAFMGFVLEGNTPPFVRIRPSGDDTVRGRGGRCERPGRRVFANACSSSSGAKMNPSRPNLALQTDAPLGTY